MASSRKTIEIFPFVRACNLALNAPESDYNTPEIRKGIASAVEQALHMARSYAGFQYTMTEDAERTAEGYLVPGTYDETRRAYYVKGESMSIAWGFNKAAA